jgi:NDP-sugar pyrophosphorylase family protein
MKTTFISVPASCSDIRKKAKALMQQHVIERIPVINKDGAVVDVILWLDYLKTESEGYDSKTPLQTPVVIMAGGKGTRLDPFTKILPKPLIPLGEKPIIEHIMDRFYRYGFYKFIVIINYKKEIIKMYFGENSLPYTVEFVEEPEYYGTAGGAYLLKKKLDETFIVTNCDTILDGNYLDFLNWHKEKQNILTIIGAHKEVTVPYGVLYMEDGCFRDINEKPKFDLFINTGTYIFEPEVLECIQEGEHLDMDRLLDRVKGMYQDGVGVYPHWDGWFDIGQWDEYKKSLEWIEGLR